MDPNMFDAEGNICIVNVSLSQFKSLFSVVNRFILNLEHGGSVEAVSEAAQRCPD